MPRPVAFLGRCRTCKGANRVDALIFTALADGITGPARFTTPEGDRLRVHSTGGRSHLTVTCSCGARAHLAQIRGTVTEHECGARCMNATGPSCECSCGGANHGRSHGGAR